jgi:hypothetical protein
VLRFAQQEEGREGARVPGGRSSLAKGPAKPRASPLAQSSPPGKMKAEREGESERGMKKGDEGAPQPAGRQRARSDALGTRAVSNAPWRCRLENGNNGVGIGNGGKVIQFG